MMPHRFHSHWLRHSAPDAEARLVWQGRSTAPETPEPETPEVLGAKAERVKRLYDILGNISSTDLQQTWDEIYADGNISIQEVNAFADRMHLELVRNMEHIESNDTQAMLRRLEALRPTSVEAVKVIAWRTGLTTLDALSRPTAAPQPDESERRQGEERTRDTVRRGEIRRRSARETREQAGDQRTILERIREEEIEVNRINTKISRCRQTPQGRRDYREYEQLNHLRRTRLQTISRLRSDFEQEAGMSWRDYHEEAAERRALERGPVRDARGRTAEEVLQQMQNELPAAHPQPRQYAGMDPSEQAVYARSPHAAYAIREELRANRRHREVQDYIISDAWAAKNLTPESRARLQIPGAARGAASRGVERPASRTQRDQNWPSAYYAPDEAYRGELERVERVNTPIREQQFRQDFEAGEFDYPDDPSGWALQRNMQRAMGFWESDPRRVGTDIQHFYSQKHEMDRRRQNRNMVDNELIDIFTEMDRGGRGALAYEKIQEPYPGMGWQAGHELTISYEDPAGRIHTYRYHPWAEISAKTAYGNDPGAMESLIDQGIVIRQIPYQTKYYDYYRSKPVVKSLEVYFRKPGKFTIQGPGYHRTIQVNEKASDQMKETGVREGEWDTDVEAYYLDEEMMQESKALGNQVINFKDLLSKRYRLSARGASRLKPEQIKVTVANRDLDGSEGPRTHFIDVKTIHRIGQKVSGPHGIWVEYLGDMRYRVYFNEYGKDGVFQIRAKDAHGHESEPVIVRVQKREAAAPSPSDALPLDPGYVVPASAYAAPPQAAKGVQPPRVEESSLAKLLRETRAEQKKAQREQRRARRKERAERDGSSPEGPETEPEAQLFVREPRARFMPQRKIVIQEGEHTAILDLDDQKKQVELLGPRVDPEHSISMHALRQRINRCKTILGEYNKLVELAGKNPNEIQRAALVEQTRRLLEAATRQSVEPYFKERYAEALIRAGDPRAKEAVEMLPASDRPLYKLYRARALLNYNNVSQQPSAQNIGEAFALAQEAFREADLELKTIDQNTPAYNEFMVHYLEYKATLAVAHIRLGESDKAKKLMDEVVERAQEVDSPHRAHYQRIHDFLVIPPSPSSS